MKVIDTVVRRIDHWQQRNRVAGLLYAVIKKFGDDQANQMVVGLGWYGFTAIYPLLLVVVTIFGFIGAASLGTRVISTLHQFPVVGTQFNPARGSSTLHGNVVGLVVGVLVLIYGAQGVTQTAQQAMTKVWNIPELERPGFLSRLGRSLISLVIIGGCFVVNAALATLVTGTGWNVAFRVLLLAGMVVINVILYVAAFRALTPGMIRTRPLVPGAAVAAVGFTLLITVGSGLLQHQIRHSSDTYGQFGVVIGLVGFLLILAKITLYAAELNPVMERRLWPRALRSGDPTPADDRMLRDLALEMRRREDQRIGVQFGPDASSEVATDAREHRD